ncbi:hypothetical protein HPB51_023644 [Rhipicephalus microplus]|uniref:Regulatory protein zeste n=1 Tax=Rhipicephalus microplus TaxID=6941 RepID=A0A9J6EJW4_RHIMP|nr:hypothetical protein HPB51_023644 [Rhipicephalus microplus]
MTVRVYYGAVFERFSNGYYGAGTSGRGVKKSPHQCRDVLRSVHEPVDYLPSGARLPTEKHRVKEPTHPRTPSAIRRQQPATSRLAPYTTRLGRQDSAWEKLTSEYNSQPGIRRVTVAQLRKLWDNEKFKWKKQSEEKRNLYATDETIQPQLRSSEGAGSPGPHTTQPPTEGACASCPSDTLAVVAPGNEESRTAAAAPEENGENLVGAGERPRPKSTRSRLAAIERVLAPEATTRMEALKNDEQRKAQLHALELRLRKQQLLHQRKMHRMQVQREQELHEMQVQLLEQQLEQQKWRFNIERQKLLFELQKKTAAAAHRNPAGTKIKHVCNLTHLVLLFKRHLQQLHA